MRQLIRDASLSDGLLRWPDDLSCGPIDTDNGRRRAVWWGHTDDDWKLEDTLNEFWNQVEKSEDRLVVWFSSHSAEEACFFLNWVDRLGDRCYEVIDVTGRQFPYTLHDGTPAMTKPANAVSSLGPRWLAAMFGSERALTNEEKNRDRQSWNRLKAENAPFRVVSPDGLVSAPETFFDQSLLDLANENWQKLARLIGDAMRNNSEPYLQVGDEMLQTRVAALVSQGKLLADGNPWNMRDCRIRSPD